MEDNQIIKKPSTIERYIMCLEEQVATISDALFSTQQELRELKSRVDRNMPIKPYHEIELEGCNLSDRFHLRLMSPHSIDPLFVRDYLKSHNIREFCMVSSFIQPPYRHVFEMVGIFQDYVYLSNAFNDFYDEFKKEHKYTFAMHVVSMNRIADYVCTKSDIFIKQMVMEKFPKPQMYKFDKQTNKVECFDLELTEPDPYFKIARLVYPVIAIDVIE
jgi:hypothetical protein